MAVAWRPPTPPPAPAHPRAPLGVRLVLANLLAACLRWLLPAVARAVNVATAARRTGPGITMALAFGVAILADWLRHCTFAGQRQRDAEGGRRSGTSGGHSHSVTAAAGDLPRGSGRYCLSVAGLFLKISNRAGHRSGFKPDAWRCARFDFSSAGYEARRPTVFCTGAAATSLEAASLGVSAVSYTTPAF